MRGTAERLRRLEGAGPTRPRFIAWALTWIRTGDLPPGAAQCRAALRAVLLAIDGCEELPETPEGVTLRDLDKAEDRGFRFHLGMCPDLGDPPGVPPKWRATATQARRLLRRFGEPIPSASMWD